MNNPLNILDFTYKFLASIVSIITITGFVSKFAILKTKKQLSEYSKFTDRDKQIKSLIEILNNDKKIINVYGKKGIGKSYFLKYFSDFVNKKIPKAYRKNIINIKLKSNTRVIYYEINEYSKDNEILNDFLLSYYNKNLKNNEQAIKRILIQSLFYKKIIIIFDNIVNECIENTVEDILNKLLPLSNKFVFVLGSIEKLTLPKLGSDKSQIKIEEFSNDEIIEYSKNCKINLSTDEIENILDVSNGLPIMVDLMISNNDYSNNELYNNYINRLFLNLKQNDKYLAEVLMYIALLSLVNSTVSLKLLNNIDESFKVRKNSIIKLHMLSLIKYNESEKDIKMHDIIRDYLVNEFSQKDFYEIIKNICSFYYGINDIFNGAVYSVQLSKKDFNSHKDSLVKCVNKAIKEENFTYSISLGNRYFESYRNSLKDELYYMISYGYILSLLSVGDYPTAKKFSDEENLSITDTIKCEKIDIAIQIADLYHLQSNYITAIDMYNIILNTLTDIDKLNYSVVCEMKIAHSYRHVGNYRDSIKHYLNAINIASSLNDYNIIALSNLELSVIYLSDFSCMKDDPRYNDLDELFEDTYNHINKSENKTTELLYYRNYARYLISKSDEYNYYLKIEDNLNLALKGYENLKKRLIYTMYFEFGEFYRAYSNTNKAIESYEKAISFSQKNGDKNLETMSYLGIVLLELDLNNYIYNHDRIDQKNLLVKTIELSEKHDLIINKTLAELLITVLNKEKITDEKLNYLEACGLRKTAETIRNNNYRIGNIQLFMM
ncbi:MAG: hypothetical protein J1F35_08875 [Erysipelotrichales bacterium]|nr:hypothetical protein [Erysipelotrichales bacterium]